MSDQITLVGFEPLYEKELSAYNSILPRLCAAAEEMGADPSKIRIVHNKIGNSSIWYDSLLAFRLKLRKNARYVEVQLDSKDAICGIVPQSAQKEVSGGFWRVRLETDSLNTYADALAKVLQNTIDRMPKEWDCCSRYMECSNAKRCIHPDSSFALGCGYRRILASGKIYYGENRNID